MIVVSVYRVWGIYMNSRVMNENDNITLLYYY